MYVCGKSLSWPKCTVGVAIAVLVWWNGSSAFAEEDVIKCGMSTAVSGPASDLGKNMQAGVLAAFHEINEEGGIHGRRLVLETLDDGYEPSRTAPNMRRLTQQPDLVAVIGNVGTPTAISAIPIAIATNTPFFGAYTGAGILRKNPPDRVVINYRASYAEETAAMVDALISQGQLRPDEIAFFTQRDGYGDAGYIGGIEALQRHGLAKENQVPHGRYERNTLAVQTGLAEILLHKNVPKAIIMVGAYAPCAQFIKLARTMDYRGVFLNVSFVGSDSLANALGDDGESVIVTQVVPHPSGDSPVAGRYRDALLQWQPDSQPTFGSFEGYIAARTLAKSFANCTTAPTRASTIDALEGLGTFEIGTGETLTLSPTQHQASHKVWPTILRDGEFVPFEWSQLEDLVDEAVR